MPFGIGKAHLPESIITSTSTTVGGGGGTQPNSAQLMGEWRADRVITEPGYTSGVLAVKTWKNQVAGPDLIPPVTGGDGLPINPSGSGASLNTGPYINIPNGAGIGNTNYQYSIVTLTIPGSGLFSVNAVGATITISGAATAAQNGVWTIQTVPNSNTITFFNYNIIGPSPFSGPDANNGSINFSIARLVAPILTTSLPNGWSYGVGGFGNTPFNYPLATFPVPGFPEVSGGNFVQSGTNMSLTTSFPMTGLSGKITVYFLWSSSQFTGIQSGGRGGLPGGTSGPGHLAMIGNTTGTQIDLNMYYFDSAAGPIPYNFVTWGTPPPNLPGIPFGAPSNLPYSSGRTSFALDPFTPGGGNDGVGDCYKLATFSIDTEAPSIPSPNFLNVDDVYFQFSPAGSPYPPQLRIYGHGPSEAGGGSFGTTPGAGNGPANAYNSLTINIGVPNIDAPVQVPFRLSVSGLGGDFNYWWSGGIGSNCANAGLNVTHILIYNGIHTPTDFTNVYNYLNSIWSNVTG